VSLLASLLLSQLAWAGGEPELSVSMQPVQLTGSPLVLDLHLLNSTDEDIEVPDLGERPSLVRFELTLRGRRERRYNTPRNTPSSRTWRIAPGEQRSLRLEIPGSAALQAGTVRVDIQAQLGDGPTALPQQTLELTTAHPVAGDMTAIAAEPGARHADVVWVHKSSEHYHLVLHLQRGDRRYQLPLLSLPEPIEPWLSRTRSDSQSERSVVWTSASNKLHHIRLRGQHVRGTERITELPWPRAEIIGHPSTDKSGVLRVPIWVPSPNGHTGDLRVFTVSGPRPSSIPRVVHLDDKPSQVLSSLDAAGTPTLYVVRPEGVDSYTPTAQTIWLRRTLWRSGTAKSTLRIALGTYPQGPEFAGGTALLVADRWRTGIATHWLTMVGDSLEPPALVSDLGRLTQLLPRGKDWPALLFEDGVLLSGGTTVQLQGSGVLAPAAQGALVWRTLTQDGPVNDRPIELVD
jgi:hypothetical protein